MILYVLIGIFIGIALFVAYSHFFKTKILSDDFSSLLDRKLPDAIKNASEHMLIVAKQQLAAEKQDIQTDLVNKKEAIEKLVQQMKSDLEETNKKVEATDKDRIGSFRALQQQIELHQKITEQLSVTTEGLKSVLSNNQLRGQFGEQVAENLLKMAGFVKGVDYTANKSQKEADTRPDFTILLPDQVKINVDVKFPYINLQKSAEAKEATTKREFLRAFASNVKDKIRQVTTRDYINPEDNTVDFVIMFVPNEMIFSYIYENMNDVWTDAMKQKVIFAGPFSFTAILRLIRQSYDNFKYEKNVRKIITYIKVFEEQFERYNEEFLKIGDRIASLSKQYDEVNATRTKQLVKTVDKITIENAPAAEPLFGTKNSHALKTPKL